MHFITKTIAALAALAALAGCDASTTNFPLHTRNVTTKSDPVAGNIAIVRLTAANVSAFGAPPNAKGGRTTLPGSDSWNYHVGIGDVLDVVVWDHPELSNPSGASRTPVESGLRVQSDGTFFYPYVGQIRASGRTPEAIRTELAEKLKEFIPSPQLVVRVVGYNSQTASVTGEVGKPSRIPLNSSALTLLDAINEAGGLTETADARQVTVRRSGRSYVVDLQAFLRQGIGSNNPVLRNGDVVSVPRASSQEAYLLGELFENASIDLTRDDITLTEAVTSVGGLKQDRADARGIFVFRNTPMGVTVYQLETTNAAAYVVGTEFYLHPQDVVYVTTAPIAKWNRLISNSLPTLTSARTASLIGD